MIEEGRKDMPGEAQRYHLEQRITVLVFKYFRPFSRNSVLVIKVQAGCAVVFVEVE